MDCSSTMSDVTGCKRLVLLLCIFVMGCVLFKMPFSADLGASWRDPKPGTSYVAFRDYPANKQPLMMTYKSRDSRLQNIEKWCNSPPYEKDSIVYNETYPYFKGQKNNYQYKEFNISYCKVPKVGCTFMMEMFKVLTTGKLNDRFLSIGRQSVHAATSSRRTNAAIPDSPIVIAARNPFTRLYSAYVDKILLPNMYFVSQIIRSSLDRKAINLLKNQKYDCANNVTFQEFLDFIVSTAKSSKSMNDHWVPISTLCRPCLTNNYMVIKQETFTADVELFLRTLNVSQESHDVIKSIMTSKRIEATIPGIVKVVMGRQKKLEKCLPKLLALKKLWKSFQVQGFIHEHHVFPERTILKALQMSKNVDYFSTLMVKAAKYSNLTKAESTLQRKKYLKQAYQDVSKETLEDIKQIYHYDFLLFNYSKEPPF